MTGTEAGDGSECVVDDMFIDLGVDIESDGDCVGDGVRNTAEIESAEGEPLGCLSLGSNILVQQQH